MDLFFEIRYGKIHIFCEVKESHKVSELKKIVHGITKDQNLENLQLFKVKDGVHITNDVLDDDISLAEAGYNNSTARAQQPAVIAVAFRDVDGKFVPKFEQVSDPPPLPDIMRSGQADSSSSSGGQKHEEQAI